jgi:hypothetical protein
MWRLETTGTTPCVRVTWHSVKKTNGILTEVPSRVYLITTGTICDIFENKCGYLILAQSTGTGKAFNPFI